jgi:flagellar biosynthesis/type III secretory pathway M-ring protein FliF/YscJ
MDVLVFLCVALILLAVVWFVAAPLRAPKTEREASDDPRVAELEARKEAKYREIRDAELDRAAGKLSEPDWRRQDAELRREAIAILRELDRVRREDG